MTETKSADQLAQEVKAAFDTRHDQVRAIAEEALGKAAKGEELSAATKQLADEALTALNEAKARLDEALAEVSKAETLEGREKTSDRLADVLRPAEMGLMGMRAARA